MTRPKEEAPVGDDQPGEDARESLRGKSTRLLHLLGAFIDLLGDSLEEGIADAERSRVVADLERFTRAVARIRKMVVEERAAEGHAAGETLLDLMREDEEEDRRRDSRDDALSAESDEA